MWKVENIFEKFRLIGEPNCQFWQWSRLEESWRNWIRIRIRIQVSRSLYVYVYVYVYRYVPCRHCHTYCMSSKYWPAY